MIYDVVIINHLYREEKYNFFFSKKVKAPPQTRPESIILNEYADRGIFYILNKQQLLLPNINYLNLHNPQNVILIDRY